MGGLSAGRLRDRVRVEEKFETVDSSGFAATVWESIGNFWASIEPLSAREFLASQQMQSQVNARIVMRYNSAVTASMRIVGNDGTVYNIAGILRDPDTGMEWMTLPVASGTNEG